MKSTAQASSNISINCERHYAVQHFSRVSCLYNFFIKNSICKPLHPIIPTFISNRSNESVQELFDLYFCLTSVQKPNMKETTPVLDTKRKRNPGETLMLGVLNSQSQYCIFPIKIRKWKFSYYFKIY